MSIFYYVLALLFSFSLGSLLTLAYFAVKENTYKEKYTDLIYQVENKIFGETRHETAKRLIQSGEGTCYSDGAIIYKGCKITPEVCSACEHGFACVVHFGLYMCPTVHNKAHAEQAGQTEPCT